MRERNAHTLVLSTSNSFCGLQQWRYLRRSRGRMTLLTPSDLDHLTDQSPLYIFTTKFSTTTEVPQRWRQTPHNGDWEYWGLDGTKKPWDRGRSPPSLPSKKQSISQRRHHISFCETLRGGRKRERHYQTLKKVAYRCGVMTHVVGGGHCPLSNHLTAW